ncbi:unnamed protein product [Meloidogyne enterolobii]|uniref:Uncharacterized protein n=1 Tax=Meloidogyne enterolobii TaxID=390850 RepID=A0ACB0XVK9_MELEN
MLVPKLIKVIYRLHINNLFYYLLLEPGFLCKCIFFLQTFHDVLCTKNTVSASFENIRGGFYLHIMHIFAYSGLCCIMHILLHILRFLGKILRKLPKILPKSENLGKNL